MTLRDYLRDDYCVRCDSFVEKDHRESGVWCNVCWDWARPLPKRLRDLIAQEHPEL